MSKIGAIDPELLKQHGQTLLDYLATYIEDMSTLSVKPSIHPGDLTKQFAVQASLSGRTFEDILEDFKGKILPGVTHWQHPHFFSYYPSASSLPAVLAELAIAAIGSVGLQWSANPIGTELECIVMDWLMRWFHADEDSPFLHSSGKGGGLIQNTAGEALVVVLTAARFRVHRLQLGLIDEDLTEQEKAPLFYQDASKLVAYMSDQTHFSGVKAARVAGIQVNILAAKRLRNGNYGIDAEQVATAMLVDQKKGLIPCYVQLNYGSTSTCGYDDITSFLQLPDRENVWLHVDAAYAGASLMLPRYRSTAVAIQQVSDSFNVNGSKWFLCGFDSAFLFVRDRNCLKDVYSATGDYLEQPEAEQVFNPEFKDWSIPLGRRFRSLRIWMVMEYFGQQGFTKFLQQAIDQGDWLREQIQSSDNFELVVETDLGLVCFHPVDSGATESLVNYLQSAPGNRYLVYPSKINGKLFIRVALGGSNTTLEDVKQFWQTCLNWHAYEAQ